MASLLRAQRAMGNVLAGGRPRPEAARAPRPGCVFCGHYERDPSQLLYKDDKCAAFLDRSPSAAAHYLVVPREHIHDTSYLQSTEEDHALVEHMLDVGQRLLAESMPGAEYQFGYHPPPFNSMPHLHLHCFALPFLPWWKRYKYVFSPIMYVSGEHLVASLEPHRGGSRPRGDDVV